MFRQISIGAAAVLTVGLLAAGCSEDGDTIISGGGGQDISNTDQFTGLSSIGAGNLAPDGGGLSPDSTDATNIRVIFCCDEGGSDGPSAAAGDAMILFTTGDGRTFASHAEGQNLTPPVELEADDHLQGSRFDIDSAAVICLETSAYENAQSGTSTDRLNEVRQNDGMWLLVMAGQTAFQDGRNDQRIEPLRGRHRTLWSWVFDPSLRSTDSVQVVAGTTTALGTSVGASRNGEYRFGFQVRSGSEIPAGIAAGNAARTGSVAGGGGRLDVPASDVTSFGLVSDGLARQASWGGSAVPPSATPAIAPTGATTLDKSEYTAGETTNIVHLIYTQIVTSLDLGGNGQFSGLNGVGFHGGSRISAFETGFNLATLEFSAVNELGVTTRQNDNTTAIGEEVGTQFHPDFLTYNQFAFMRYNDLSLNDTVGAGVDPFGVESSETIIVKLSAQQDTAGGSTLIAGTQDLALRTSATGVHTLFDNLDGTTGFRFNNETERQAFLDDTQSVYGRDEGFSDTVIFYLTTDGTQTGSTSSIAAGEDTSVGANGEGVGNSDTVLMAAHFTTNDVSAANSTTDGVLVDAPVLVSRHDQDDSSTTVALASQVDEFADEVDDVELQINRTGEYIAIAYTQAEGNSASGTGFTTITRDVLRATAYQTARFGATTVAAFTQAGRFAAPIEFSAFTVDPVDGLTTGTNLTGLPVNGFGFQDNVDYRCGFQSDANVVWLLWEQSDDTEDRLFVRALRVGPQTTGAPTLNTPATTIIEIDGTPSVLADAVNINGVGGATPSFRSTFTFVNGSLDGDFIAASDLGTAGASTSAQNGGLLVVYRKVVDATRPTLMGVANPSNTTNLGDADGADAAIFAAGFLPNGTAAIQRTQIDNNFNEDVLDGATQADLLDNLATGSILELVPVSPSVEINQSVTGQTAGSYAAPATRVFFDEPTAAFTAGSNGSNGLFTRNFDGSIFAGGSSTGGATDFDTAFEPDVGAAGLPPVRLDHLTGGNVEGLIGVGTGDQILVNGTTVLVLFREDGHIWGQTSSDGVTYLTSNGAPNPALIDNDNSANVQGATDQLWSCHGSDCNVDRVVITFRKADINGDVRQRLRISN